MAAVAPLTAESAPIALSGQLGDISVADLLQFIYLGGRTGRLSVTHGAEQASVAFCAGRIVTAWGPGAKRLGELLVEAGAIESRALGEALERQRAEESPSPLGQILLAMGVIDADRLDREVSRQVERIVRQMVSWDSGQFQFTGEESALGPLTVGPQDFLPRVELNTQLVLLDALRLFDERNRAGPMPELTPSLRDRSLRPGREEATRPERTPATRPEPAPVRRPGACATAAAGQKSASQHLFVVSDDEAFVAQLASAARVRGSTVARLYPYEAPLRLKGHPLVVIDARPGLGAPEGIAPIHKACPGAALLVVLELGSDPAPAYAQGAVAVLPPEATAVLACARSMDTHQRRVVRGPQNARRADIARLRRVFEDLRTGLISTTISLNLMSIVSESAERAVLFLAVQDSLAALGAFGATSDGNSLAVHTRGLTLPVGADSLLAEVMRTGQARSLPFDEARLPPKLRELLGRPESGQIALFPVLGASRVIALVYADNGSRAQSVAGLDFIELAAAQVGLAFENELLRRKVELQRG